MEDNDTKQRVQEMNRGDLVNLVAALVDSGQDARHDYCYVETRVTPHEDYRCRFCRLVANLDFS